MKILDRIRAWRYRHQRRTLAKAVRRIQEAENRGIIKNAVINLPGVRGYRIVQDRRDSVTLIGPGGYESSGYDLWLEDALRKAAAQHIWWMLGKAKP